LCVRTQSDTTVIGTVKDNRIQHI